MAVTLEIVAQCLCGAEVAGVADRVGKAMQVVTDRFITDASQALLIPFDLPDFLVPARRDAISDLDEIINGIIRERRALHQRRGDLLDTLLHARDAEGQPMTDTQLRDEVMTLFLAGHETTAISLSWTCYLLSQHPQVEAKLVEELQDSSRRPRAHVRGPFPSALHGNGAQRIHATLPRRLGHRSESDSGLRNRRLSSD